ncbi:MAG: hypothetical protein P8080_11550 [Gammaproteobacteria bacterium]
MDEMTEIYEERAAILEHEAGWPRAIAESEARRLVTHLRWLRGERRPQWIEPPAPEPGAWEPDEIGDCVARTGPGPRAF